MSLLVTFEILGLFLSTLTVEEMNSFPNTENLQQTIQMILCKK